jgi:hypothetical protein
MNFELNYIILNKMGWVSANYYIQSSIIRDIINKITSKEEKVFYYFIDNDKISLIVLNNDAYEFLTLKDDFINRKPKRIKIDNNLHLMKLIRESLSCNTLYKRIFKINSINNEKRS